MRLVILLVCFFIYKSLCSEKNIELEVIYEKTFDEPVVDVIFDTATVTIEEAKRMGWKEKAFSDKEKDKGKVLISYPRAVLVCKESARGYDGWYMYVHPKPDLQIRMTGLKFYSKNGEFLKELEIGKNYNTQYVYLSPQRKYILVSNIPTEYLPDHRGGALYDFNGNKIWEIEEHSPIAVSDEGYAIAAYLDWGVPPEPGGDFYVYNPKGKLIATIENPLKDKTAPLDAYFSKDSEYALLCFRGEGAPPTIFMLITKEGKILWKKDFLEYIYTSSGGSVDILPYKGVAGDVSTRRTIFHVFLIDWQGNLKWFKPVDFWGGVITSFSQDGEKIYFCSSRGYIGCFKRSDGSILWEHKEWMPKSRRVDPSMNIPNFSQIFEHFKFLIARTDSALFFFDKERGELKKKLTYPGKKIFLTLHNGIPFVIEPRDKKILGLKIEEE